LPASEEDLLNRLLRGYAEEVRSASGLTRHLGLADLQDAKKSIQINSAA